MDVQDAKSFQAKDQALTYSMTYVIEELKEKFNKITNMNKIVENELDFYLGVVSGFVISKYYQNLILQNALITEKEMNFINDQLVNQLPDLKFQIQSLFKS